ncbi:MAG: multiheme c-type cytochrome [Kofleriaceae bacterium]
MATGLDGTPMVGFGASVPTAELWALATFVDELLPAEHVGAPALPALATATIEADRVARLRAGTWPGAGAPDEAALFGGTIALQGAPPSSLAPAQASLRPPQCGRCHAKQLREWGQSLHARAASPGLRAQLVPGDIDAPAEVEACQRCHAPLAEQLRQIRPGHAGGDDDDRTYAANPAYDAELAGHGIACAACHVRGWTRHGPPGLAPSLLPLPSYPFSPLAIYERSDLCLPCHQLPARQAVAGRPLLDTYREWLMGPYMPRGVQCQHCHMPNREHTFLGVHDPTTFRQAIAVDARAYRSANGIVTVRAGVTNVGAGHYLPTTPTPAAWITVTLRDGAGATCAGPARASASVATRAPSTAPGSSTRTPGSRRAPAASSPPAGAAAGSTPRPARAW